MTLTGDAAHPMYPVGSNGGSQAIIDASVLARSLTTAPFAAEALAAYEAARLPAVNKIVLANRSMPVDAVLDAGEPGALRDAYRATSQEDVAALNSRPPILPVSGRIPRR